MHTFLFLALWISWQPTSDPLALFVIAADHAAANRRDQAISALDSLSHLPGGLDPSFARPFLNFRGDPRYDRIMARIRAANPPIVRSQVAFSLAERDLQPEGIAYDARSRSVFAGSFKGKIIRIDASGNATDFAKTSARNAPRVVVGLRVDNARRRLWAVVDDPRAFGDAKIGGAVLQVYDLETRVMLRRVIGPPTGALNDVTITSDGEAYATNTSDGSVWRATVGRDRMELFLPPGTVPEANGITLSPDDTQLFIAGADAVYRTDIGTRATARVSAPTGVFTGSMDGLYWYQGALIGIQNGIHPGRVMHYALSASGERIVRATVLERYHPLFNGVTTAAVDGRTLLYFANTQSRAFRGDGALLPGVQLEPIRILRLPLP